MTENEKRQQKGELLLDYQEAENTLAHLREKGTTIAGRISTVAKWVESVSRSYESVRTSDQKYSTDVEVLNDPQLKIAMDFDAAAKVVQQIREAKTKVDELAQRKQSLGLR
ncbi:MAG: hypothetical protein NVS1B11_36040 [Terriglobales bacterium]